MPIDPRSPLLVFFFLSCAVGADAQVKSAPVQQRGGTFFEPPAVVDPVYLPAGPDRPAGPQPDDGAGISLRMATELPLTSMSGSSGLGAQGSQQPSTTTAQVHLRWQRPGEPWFVQVGFYRYLRGDRQQPWNPDFTYGFGYDSPEPDTWSLAYANYAGNRLLPEAAAKERRFNFDRGQWSLGYKFKLPEWLEPVFLAGDGDSAMCSTNLNLTPRYTDQASGKDRSGKQSLALGCRWSHPDGWFAHLTAFDHPGAGEQQPWDPDFTYGFGVSGWPAPGMALQYANYSGNRFPGRSRAAGQGSWRNGSVSLSWGTAW